MASECSSGCESGWTSYLEQSLSHKSKGFNHRKKSFCDEYRKGKGVVVVDDGDDGGDEDEDLSMVSDASSGPPHFYEDNNGNYFNDHHQYSVVPKGITTATATTLNKNGGKRHRNKQQQQQHQRQREDHQEDDDTASSPLINFSKNNFVHTNINPQGFSATHFQGGPAFQDHFGFLQSSPSGNHLQQQGHQWF